MSHPAINSNRFCSVFKKTTLLFGILLIFQLSFAQNDTPCEGAQRWTQGSTWLPGGSIDDAPNAGFPNGIIRCGSSAETQSQVMPYNNSIYDAAQFEIDISGIPCVDPSTQTTVFPSNPTTGQPIIWLNFDVRAFAGSFEIQINDNSGDNIAWVLYSSNVHQAGTTLAANGQQLSGDCGDLKRIACGVESSSTWNTIPIEGEDFLEPANMYLAVWDQDADGDLAINNFKARFGCGDSDVVICSLNVEDPIVSCVTDGTYSVTVPINGANGQYTATDPNALSISSDICLGNLGGGAISGSFTLTYNQGADFNIDITPVIPSTGCEDPLNPTQCTGNVSGVSPPPGTPNVNDNETVCEGDEYIWPYNGLTYQVAEGENQLIVELNETDTNGCPFTAILTLNEHPVTPDDTATGEVCVGIKFTYEGLEYDPGTYNISKVDANGCPYITVLTVNTYPVTPDVNDSETLCEGDEYVWPYNGLTYQVAEGENQLIVELNETDANGCPFTATLTLNEYPVTPDVNDSETVCEGDEYVWPYNGLTYQVAEGENQLIVELNETDANGCPFTATLTLNEHPVTPDVNDSETVCEGDEYVWPYNGLTYQVAEGENQLIVELNETDANGCPFTATLTLNEYPVTPDVNDSETVCEGDEYVWPYNGLTYQVAEGENQLIVELNETDANGCPFTATLTLNEHPVTPDVNDSETVCEGDEYVWPYNGLTYQVAEGENQLIVELNETDANGCPFTATLTLNEHPVTPDVNDSETVCEGDEYVWPYNGLTYQVAEGENQLIVELNETDANGCPFTATLTLNEHPVTPDVNDSEIVCEGDEYVWPYNGLTYQVAEGENQLIVELNETDANGCPFTATLTLNEHPVTPDVNDSETVCEGDEYVWTYNGLTYQVAEGENQLIVELNETDANGCPFTATLTLNEYPVTPDVNDSETVCEGDEYVWPYNGLTYQVAEGENQLIVELNETDTNGCPFTATLTLNEHPVTPDVNDSETVCEGDEYVWPYNGLTYQVAEGENQLIVELNETDTNGCPFIATLTLNEYPVTPDIVNNVTICEGDSYEWSVDGGTYTILDSPVILNLSDSNGCPYTATLTITEDDAPYPGEDGTLTVCEGVTPTNADLFGALDGLPDEGGVWSGPVAGVYTYTFAASGSCPEVSATVTVDNYPVTPDVNESETVCEGDEYVWPYNGLTYQVAEGENQLIVELNETDANGCPFTATLTLNEYPVTPDVNDSETVCEGDEYVWPYNGLTYQVAEGENQLIVELNETDTNGCPFIATLTLNEYPVTPDIVNNVTICEGDSYEWSVDGGTYTILDSPVILNLSDSNGCPYTATLTITEDDAPYPGEDGTLTVCEGVTPTNADLFGALDGLPDEGGVWSGPVAGVYTYTFAASGSCPEVSATVTVDNYPVTPDVNESETVCEGDEYVWPYNGLTYQVAEGENQLIVELNETDANGCPFTATLTLNEYPVTPDVNDSETVCEGDEYVWPYNGLTYQVAEGENQLIVELNETDTNGCPFTATLTLNEHPVTPDVNDSETVCEGDEYVWPYNGLTYQVAEGENQLIVELNETDANGCPFIATLTLNEHPVTPDVNDSETVCEGDEYVWFYNGLTYQVAEGENQLIVELNETDANGCPFTATLTLNEYPVTPDVNDSETVCEGDEYVWPYNGLTYQVAEGENQLIVELNETDTNGCPFIATLTLNEYPVTPDIVNNVTICEGDSYEWSVDGGTYTILDSPVILNLSDSNGCPYTATLTITEDDAPYPGEDGTLTVCEGVTPTNADLFGALDGLPDEGGVWSGPVAGVYTYTFAASGSCPEVSATVTVDNYPVTPDVNESETVCEGDEYVWPYNGLTYQVAEGENQLIVELNETDDNGCPFTATLTLNEHPVTLDVYDSKTVCEGEEYIWSYNGLTYQVAQGENELIVELQETDANGCPFTATLNLNEYPITPDDTAEGEVCEGNKFVYEGLAYDPGTYNISKVDVNGCPYTTVLTVTTFDVTPDVLESVTICPGTLYTWNLTGASYEASDSPVELNLLDENGCYYGATLIIDEYPETQDIIIEAEVCPGDNYIWPLNGNTYSLSDSPVTIIVFDPNGCQYNATLNLNPKVIELTHPSFETICLQGGLVPLFGGEPSGGIYSGLGVVDTKAGYSLDPTILGEGVHGITYTYASGTGCEVGIKFKVEIIDCCVNEDAYAYAPDPGGNYEWCFLDTDQLYNNDWGWTNGGLDLETQDEFGNYNTYTFDLYAGSVDDCDPTDENSPAMLVGTVTLVREDDDIVVTYEVDDSLSDDFNFELGNVNVHLDCDAFPCEDNSSQNRSIETQERRFCIKTTDPEEYQHSSFSQDGNTATITIPVSSVLQEGCLDDFYLIAYADVEVCVNVEYKDEKQRLANFDHSFDFKAYPVPYEDVITIAMELDFESDISIQVMDIRGMILEDVTIKDYVENSEVKTQINLSRAKDQILFVKVTTNYGSVIKKIVSSNKK